MNAGVADITISLPKENEDIKKYNGVDWWYWLASARASSAAYFCNVNSLGLSGNSIASAVGGVAPGFCVA
jgi:hypothetical protein